VERRTWSSTSIRKISRRDAQQKPAGLEKLKNLGAEVIGISGDNQKSHRDFAEEHKLPFILLSDPDGSVRKSYGVKKTLGLIPGRVSFVIDKNGIVRHVFSSQSRATAHVDEALAVVKCLT